MATILLQNTGAALGSVFGPVGAILGRAAGAMVGNRIDQALFGQDSYISAASLQGARIASSEEGTPIPKLYGTMRLAGNLIWATRFEEDIVIERQGGKGTSQSSQSTETKYYYANFAVGICEGPIAHVKRIWADGRELDRTQYEIRVYHGSYDQLADPLIEAKQGSDSTPAYRGLAYVVFDRLPLENFGNRIPVLHFEVTRVISALENQIDAVTLIPGATEHGLATEQVSDELSDGELRLLNHNMNLAQTDIIAALDELQSLCPNLKAIGLVISWFGDDLRAGSCKLRPGVEVRSRTNESRTWTVGSDNRASAHLVSYEDGGPVYGGTPNDQSVLDAIKEIKSRGLRVTLYPFILMDIPSDNSLPSPDGTSSQNAYPWRGRITCDPEIGATGSADQTAQAAVQISNFIGAATISSFSINNSQIAWSGADYGYRHFILHNAYLAKLSANLGYPVDAFLIGSEMVSLTRVRDGSGNFPFVDGLIALAADVQTVLGVSVDITYAADWTEYFGYQPADGSDDVFFHLDDLWASAAISAVGIDNYMPVSDWRDDDRTQTNPDGFVIQTDVDALMGQIEGGEGFDWYYQSYADRKDRIRTDITDGLGKPWVFRFKDVRAWWSNEHYNRNAGVESASSTAWVPGSKPIWFTEFGSPAVDKGANQPNVFPDPKSSESAYPYFSSQMRDDQAQRALLMAHINYWNSDQNLPQFVDPENCYIWTWDARPFPAFPQNDDVWSDGDNWRTGHWINGRLGNAPLGELIAAILEDYGFTDYDVGAVEGSILGYVQPSLGSARSLLEPILKAYQIDVKEGADTLIFSSRTKMSQTNQAIEYVVDEKDMDFIAHQRIQEGELANEMHLEHHSPWTDYASASAYSRRLSRKSQRQEHIGLNAAIDDQLAILATDDWLQDHWASRDQIDFKLPITDYALEIGDRITFSTSDFSAPQETFQIAHIEDGIDRQIHARRYLSVQTSSPVELSISAASSDANAGFSPSMVYLDLPILSGYNQMNWARCAGYVSPWTPLTISSSATAESYNARVVMPAPCTIGKLVQDLSPGPEGRLDYANQILVNLTYGAFESITKDSLLLGGNVLAVQSNNGDFEILQFLEASEEASDQWLLTGLLRAQAGTDDAMREGASLGASVVFINDAVTSLELDSSEMGVEMSLKVSATGQTDTDLPTTSFTGGVRANTPISPVHLNATRNNEGILFSWVRRSRYQADSWLGTDVPMDEDSLSFQLDILSGEQIIRSIETSDMFCQYTSLNEITDFGAPQTQISFQVRQLGGLIASGIARSAQTLL